MAARDLLGDALAACERAYVDPSRASAEQAQRHAQTLALIVIATELRAIRERLETFAAWGAS